MVVGGGWLVRECVRWWCINCHDVVVSDYAVLRFLGRCRLLSPVSRGLGWNGDMVSPKNSENTNIFSCVKEA